MIVAPLFHALAHFVFVFLSDGQPYTLAQQYVFLVSGYYFIFTHRVFDYHNSGTKLPLSSSTALCGRRLVTGSSILGAPTRPEKQGVRSSF